MADTTQPGTARDGPSRDSATRGSSGGSADRQPPSNNLARPAFPGLPPFAPPYPGDGVAASAASSSTPPSGPPRDNTAAGPSSTPSSDPSSSPDPSITHNPRFQRFTTAATAFYEQVHGPMPTATETEFAPAEVAAPAVPERRGRDVPEWCWSWTKHRAGQPATVHMFCARRDLPPGRAEDLALLRSGVAPPPPVPGEPLTSTGRPRKMTGWFQRWRDAVLPWSLIYVRGTNDGVAGRYAEELEGDDGQYDFGPLSRHAPLSVRREADGGWQYLDWAEHGALFYIPAALPLFPILNLDIYAQRVFGPARRMLGRMYESWRDGSQMRMAGLFYDNARDGGAFKLVGEMRAFHRRQVEAAVKRKNEALHKQMDEAVEAERAKQSAEGGEADAFSASASASAAAATSGKPASPGDKDSRSSAPVKDSDKE